MSRRRARQFGHRRAQAGPRVRISATGYGGFESAGAEEQHRLVMLAFVVCHLTAHALLPVSMERAEAALILLMYPWATAVGTVILAAALLAHYLNALWSIYARRYLRLSRWEWWQGV
jgi:succinate dehydrogenase/fumarate reductase cytochrome b subunit